MSFDQVFNEELLSFYEESDPLFKLQVLSEVQYKKTNYPIYSFVIGNPNPTLPTLGLFGGVHGLERVGSQVVLQFLRSFLNELKWNTNLRESLNHFRIVGIPVINPVGVARFTRSNGRGVDLMRNAPIEAEEKSFYKIHRGHRISPTLPWYRGEELEVESKALIEFVKKEMFLSKASLAIDFHSGFGLKDRLWYPYAKSKNDFPYVEQAKNISKLLTLTHPHHIYHIEPQSSSYTTHGDLWDYIFDSFLESKKHNDETFFMPWTLEMGSWIWLKKNPSQIFRKDGIFNPIVKHRESRTFRRHFLLIDFFTKLVRNSSAWEKNL